MEGRRTGTINVWVTDAVTVTPFGDNLNALWRAVLAGKSAIRPLRRFAVEGYHAGIASWIEDLAAIGNRSMCHFLTERLLRQLDPMPPNTLLITATTKSGIDNLERLRRGLSANPADVLPSGLFEEVRRQLKLTGECFNISAACASSTIALAQGAELIASGYSDAVLVCCLDLVTEFVFAGFSSLQALSADPCRPFDRDRNGLSLGEGAAALLLINGEQARQEGRSHLGTILGWAAANDARHITAPAQDGRGLRQAILQALDIAGRNADEIAAVCAHGTGTVHNDLMELYAFNRIFGNRRLPIFSIKGSIGHTLGAAGGIEVAVGLRTLSEQTAPPTVGFSNPERGAEKKVSMEPQAFSGDCLLTTNSGFGGINAALILGKGSLQ
jgi:3-oxoacyl-[acyl-carrier-protein] synthase II